MIVKYVPGNDGMINWRTGITGAFVSRDGQPAQRIEYNPDKPMTAVHELGHLLDCRYIDLQKVSYAMHRRGCVGYIPRDAYLHLIRAELRAWRIAKSICKPELWDEADALGENGLGSYIHWVAIHGGIHINRAKLRIVPLNRGVKLTAGPDSVISKRGEKNNDKG